ncbi:hypothetical protein [Ruegeria sp. HKCCD7255]|uniref:hypothetical protein n=1 Tax=Ruegeria sp. HKCCD7255 TaxID=2683004 RepID=UPI001488846B|nr:hypothetical protein [Ruegeria sp. HKCCD7255]
MEHVIVILFAVVGFGALITLLALSHSRAKHKSILGMEATDVDLVNKVQAENDRLERMNKRD